MKPKDTKFDDDIKSSVTDFLMWFSSNGASEMKAKWMHSEACYPPAWNDWQNMAFVGPGYFTSLLIGRPTCIGPIRSSDYTRINVPQ
jgi:hypothetical protein